MVLYIFLTHQKNINNCYDRIRKMMVSDFIIIQGGFIKDEYDQTQNILNLNCDDTYSGLPEKVIKTLHFLMSDERFDKYTHFCKLDDDMKLIKKFDKIEGDYLGNIHYGEGNRKWHIGRCGNFWDKIPYLGEFKPWCMGGFGYIVSRNALSKFLPDFNYSSHIYEDVYMGLLMNNINILPTQINMSEYLISPDHL